MPGRLADKVALVMGAGAAGPGWGNGKAAAVLFAREGAKVLAVDINRDAAAETAAIITGEGGTAEMATADVAVAADVERVVAQCRQRFGRIDVLHYNVGILKPGGPVELSEADWDRVIDVNLKGAFLSCKYALPALEAHGKGAIVLVSSLAAHRYSGYPYVSYSTSKSGLLMFARSVAMQYAKKGVRVNIVSPGMMDTPMAEVSLSGVIAKGDIAEMKRLRASRAPMGRMGDAWDVAYAALYLASDEAKYVTGAELVVDGGLACRYA